MLLINNNPWIVIAEESNPVISYIQRVSDNVCSSPNDDSSEPKHQAQFVWSLFIGCVILACTSTVHSGGTAFSQAYYNHYAIALILGFRN